MTTAPPLSLIVGPGVTGERLDKWLAAALGLTRSQAERLIDGGAALVNDKRPKKAGDRLRDGDRVAVVYIKEGEKTLRSNTAAAKPDEAGARVGAVSPELKTDVKIVSEADDYIIIVKPAGLVVHPGAQSVTRRAVLNSPTLASWVLKHYPETWGVGEYSNRPGLPHRLDRETSGLMAVAKNQAMFDSLKAQFQDRRVEKKYWALVYGEVEHDEGVIDFPIGRREDGRMAARPVMRAVTLRNVKALQSGRTAVTEFKVAERFHGFTLLDVALKTGRTHQIRVHLFAYNHPVVGDRLYSQKKLISYKTQMLHRLFLHAYRLCFTGLSGARVCYESSLPDELAQFLNKLKTKNLPVCPQPDLEIN